MALAVALTAAGAAAPAWGSAAAAAGPVVTVPLGTEFTISGGDCLLHGVPGTVAVSLLFDQSRDHQVLLMPDTVAGDNGDWWITVIVTDPWIVNGRPEPAQTGRYQVRVVCYDPQDAGAEGKFKEIEGDVKTVIVVDALPVAPGPTTTTAGPPAPPTRPAPVRVRPRFTG